MFSGKYIWQSPNWPRWQFDLHALAPSIERVSHAQGLLQGRLADVGLALRDQASLAVLTEDVLKTSEIPGESLNVASVRSSIARRLGVDIGALAPVDRHVEGAVQMVLDATANSQQAEHLDLRSRPAFRGLCTPCKYTRSLSGHRNAERKDCLLSGLACATRGP